MVWKSNCLKMKLSFLQILLFVSSIWLSVSGHWGWGLSVLLVILLQIFYFIRNQIFIPKLNSTLEICPNCKNPNTQNLKICEWCGRQII